MLILANFFFSWWKSWHEASRLASPHEIWTTFSQILRKWCDSLISVLTPQLQHVWNMMKIDTVGSCRVVFWRHLTGCQLRCWGGFSICHGGVFFEYTEPAAVLKRRKTVQRAAGTETFMSTRNQTEQAVLVVHFLAFTITFNLCDRSSQLSTASVLLYCFFFGFLLFWQQLLFKVSTETSEHVCMQCYINAVWTELCVICIPIFLFDRGSTQNYPSLQPCSWQRSVLCPEQPTINSLLCFKYKSI